MAPVVRPDFRPAPRREGLTHEAAMLTHARKRLRERYGRKFSTADIDVHTALICSGACTQIRAQATRVVYLIEDRGHVLYPVWDKTMRAIVTYLVRPSHFWGCGEAEREIRR